MLYARFVLKTFREKSQKYIAYRQKNLLRKYFKSPYLELHICCTLEYAQCSLCVCCSKSKYIGVVLTRSSQQVLCSSPRWKENESFYLWGRIEGRAREKERMLIALKGLKDILQESALLAFLP